MKTRQGRRPRIEPGQYPADTGCFAAPSCLNCPLETCWLENPAILVVHHLHPRQQAQAAADALHITLAEWIDRQAAQAGVKRATIIRRLRLE